jgi:hypothetical protein
MQASWLLLSDINLLWRKFVLRGAHQREDYIQILHPGSQQPDSSRGFACVLRYERFRLREMRASLGYSVDLQGSPTKASQVHQVDRLGRPFVCGRLTRPIEI